MARKPNPALLAPKDISSELEAVVGKGPLPRGQIIKKLWEYIKGHNLNKGRIISPDETLSKVLGKEPLDMMQMGGKLKTHIKK